MRRRTLFSDEDRACEMKMRYSRTMARATHINKNTATASKSVKGD